jgi:integrase
MICGIVTSNPTSATPNKFIAKRRDRERALSEAEIGLFLRRLTASDLDGRLKCALRLILLTLVRKSELRLARWEHVDLTRGEWEIPPEASKTGKGQIVYLAPQAKRLFEQIAPLSARHGCVLATANSQNFPISASTLNRALNRYQAGMVHFTVHDLRRTAATRLSEMGYAADWIEKAMNHTIRGVRGVYNRAQYAEERRKMLTEWAASVDRMEAGKAN